ncbi:hypothetical protein Cgig2_030073 [Carnegiea gigantea]|uniref:Uncharacterized protein n=1 Tax=Carnegiea gigantea TaxID=171969 RepID=A0A9Q1JZG1_9CARY|nr:hypothetical protein Cgig2_030073 [Carnegiea gigantea]
MVHLTAVLRSSVTDFCLNPSISAVDAPLHTLSDPLHRSAVAVGGSVPGGRLFALCPQASAIQAPFVYGLVLCNAMALGHSGDRRSGFTLIGHSFTASASRPSPSQPQCLGLTALTLTGSLPQSLSPTPSHSHSHAHASTASHALTVLPQGLNHHSSSLFFRQRHSNSLPQALNASPTTLRQHFRRALTPVEEMNVDDLCGDVMKLHLDDGGDGEVTSKFSSGSGTTPKSGIANDLNEEEAVVIGATTAFWGLRQRCLGTIIIETPIMKLGFLKYRVSLLSIDMSTLRELYQ